LAGFIFKTRCLYYCNGSIMGWKPGLKRKLIGKQQGVGTLLGFFTGNCSRFCGLKKGLITKRGPLNYGHPYYFHLDRRNTRIYLVHGKLGFGRGQEKGNKNMFERLLICFFPLKFPPNSISRLQFRKRV